MKNRKRLLCVVIMLCLAMIGCGNKTEEETVAPEISKAPPVSSETVKEESTKAAETEPEIWNPAVIQRQILLDENCAAGVIFLGYVDADAGDLEQNRDVEGNGLGLAITHRLVTMMNAKIEAESEYGKGSTFTVYLKQELMGTDCIGDFEKNYRKSAETVVKYEQSFTAPDASILVVDDNQMNLMVVQNLLKDI